MTEMRAPRGQTVTMVSSFLFYKCVFDEMSECERYYEYMCVCMFLNTSLFVSSNLVCVQPLPNSDLKFVLIANKWYQS